jgi:glycosyltransferase involved in cell wall biosynthesis
MKLNWFSPLPPARTEIAYHTRRVLPALSALAEITLWTDQARWDAGLKKYAEVRRYRLTQMPWTVLNRGDVSIYHIGNNPLFHGSIWQVSRLHPGIVVLHDFHLHHFFDGLYRVQWQDPYGYLAKMEFYYGETGRRDAAECFKSGARNIDDMAERYPLTPLALENALGVFVHTQKAFDSLKRENRWPVVYASLPFSATPCLPSDGFSGSARRAGGPPYRLIVFGYIGHNRRLDALLKAFTAFPQRNQFRLDVYGQLLDGKHVGAQIRSLGLQRLVTLPDLRRLLPFRGGSRPVTFHGFVPEAELDNALSAAHLAINLRYPTTGEASASQLRIWAHALPSLVTDVGWYATLPADTVAFVRPAHEIEDLQSHLSAFLADPVRFVKMGEKGRQLLEQHHTLEGYAKALVTFAASVQRF